MYREHTVLKGAHDFIKEKLVEIGGDWEVVELYDRRNGGFTPHSNARASINRVARDMGVVVATSDQIKDGLLHAKRIA